MRTWGLLFVFLGACSSSGDGGGTGGPDGPGPGEGGEGVALTLPQAIDGALWANSQAYPTIPVRVDAGADVERVVVRLGEQAVEAVHEGDRHWRADVDISDYQTWVGALEVFALDGDEVVGETAVDLGIGVLGVQLTRWAEAMAAGTPRVHRLGDQAWVTWCDRSAGGQAIAWLQRIDGAGRFVGNRVALVSSDSDVIYARTAFGASTIGVLYQEPGGPYKNRFVMTDHEGNPVMDAVALDADWLGSFGGDIAYDGTGYVMTWRSNQGAGKSRVMWAYVAEADGAVTGPVEVAAAGDGNPHGDIQPISFVSIDVVGETSLVGFVRERFDAVLELSVPKSQLVAVKRDGSVARHEFAGPESDWTYHQEARVFSTGDRLLALWTLTDLLDESPNPPRQVYGTLSDPTGALDPGRGKGRLVLSPPDAVDEPFFLTHPAQFGVLAWTDGRGYDDENPTLGKTELYVAPVDSGLKAGEPTRFLHSKFIPGTGEVNAANAGTNVLLLWVDERNGGSILNPRPEMWFETAWY